MVAQLAFQLNGDMGLVARLLKGEPDAITLAATLRWSEAEDEILQVGLRVSLLPFLLTFYLMLYDESASSCQYPQLPPHSHHHLQKLEIADAQQRSMLELLLQNKSTLARRERLAYLRNTVTH